MSGRSRMSPLSPLLRAARAPRRVLLTLLAVGLVGGIAGYGTWAAFTATTSNAGNAFTAGTVEIGDNDLGASTLSLSNAKPGDTATGCITVTYTGSLAANVGLYLSSLTGTGLGQYLTLTITRGTDAVDPFGTCTNFAPDATDYIGAGNGVIYSGNLSALQTTYAAGLEPTAGAPATWTNGSSHVYEFQVVLQDNNAAQGLDATAEFTWEAQNT